jgi:hypothetical protein
MLNSRENLYKESNEAQSLEIKTKASKIKDLKGEMAEVKQGLEREVNAKQQLVTD